MSRRYCRAFSWMILCVSAFSLPGCGFDRIQPALPNAFEDFTFEELEAIQDDERLTDTEKRQAIRDAIDAPLTPEGDRLVEFLLTFPVP